MGEDDRCRVGIVTTIRLPEGEGGGDDDDDEARARGASALTSFIRYHLAKGFDHLFVFLDARHSPSPDDDGNDNNASEEEEEEEEEEEAGRPRPRPRLRADYCVDVAKAVLDGFPASSVTAVLDTPALRERQRVCCRQYARFGVHAEREVQARQVLNAEMAMQMALSGTPEMDPLDWLVHLDLDELFYTAEASVKPHFAGLARKGVVHMTYTNHEGVPERECVGDYFRDVTLFRRHYLSVGLTEPARCAMAFWERRTNHGQYMLVYDNGKSAARVAAGVYPKSVHEWATSAGEEEEVNGAVVGGAPRPDRHRRCTALVDPRCLDMRRVLKCDDPCVLHYPVCGFDWFRDKYAMLGRFEDAWFGGELPIAPSFHLDARDVVVGAGGSVCTDGGREEMMRHFFRRQVLFATDTPSGKTELSRQLESKVCVRLFGPQQLLRSKPGDEDDGHCDGGVTMAAAAAATGCEGVTAVESETEDPPCPPSPSSIAPQFSYEKAWIVGLAAQAFLAPPDDVK